jgi:hypothetical protein
VSSALLSMSVRVMRVEHGHSIKGLSPECRFVKLFFTRLGMNEGLYPTSSLMP